MPGQKTGGKPPSKPHVLTPAERRQAAALATIMGDRTLTNAGLGTPGENPFAAQAPKSHKPAKDKYVPGLTTRTAVARGKQQRADQHGLLTPAQRKAEAKATEIAPRLPTFHELHDLRQSPAGDLTQPVLPHMTLQEIVDMLGAGRRGAAGAFVAPPSAPTRPEPGPAAPTFKLGAIPVGEGRTRAIEAQPVRHSLGRISGETADWLGRNILGTAAQIADKGIATGAQAAATAAAEAFNPGALRIKGNQGGLAAADNPASKIKPLSGMELASRIQRGGFTAPDISINLSDITGLAGGTPAGAATGQKGAIPFSELAGKTGWGLTPEAKKRGLPLILKNGWTRAQVEAMGGDATTFIEMQYNKPESLAQQLLRATGADIVSGGSQTVGLVGAAGQILQGNGVEAAKQYGDLIRQVLPAIGKHPYGDEFVAHPFFAATAGLAGAKGLSAAGRLRPPIAREVKLAGHEDPLTGEPLVMPMGDYDRNLYIAAGQGAKDLLARSSSRFAKRAFLHGIGDIYVRQQRARQTPGHVATQVPYIKSERSLPAERKQDLMAIVDYGGAPGIRNAIEHFAARHAEGVHEVPQARLELGRLLDVADNLTAEDHAWIAAHADIARHTSDLRQTRGAHSADTQLYRQYETPIEMGASAERRAGVSGPYTRAIEARDEYLHMHDTGGPTPRWLGRQKEIARDIKVHTRGASTKMAKLVKQYAEERKAYLADLKPWRAEQKAIKAREPAKPVAVAPAAKAPEAAPAPAPKAPRGKLTRTTKVHVFATKKDAAEFAVNEVKSHNAEHFEGTGDEKLKATARVEPNPKGKGHIVTITRPTREKAPEAPAAAAPVKATPKGKPVVDAKAKAAHDAWKAELAAHNEGRPKAPERPKGLPRHAGRLSVHEGEVTKQTRRAKGYAEAEAIRHPEKDKAQIAQEYHEAVNEAVATHHAEPGAMIPARVARIQPPLDKRGKFHRGQNLTSNLNIPKGHVSTGESARSGHYVYDTSSPLRENFAEQLTNMKTGLYNGLVGHPLVHDVEGGGPKLAARIEAEGGSDAEIAAAREPRYVPAGYKAVPIHYPGSHAQVTEPSWHRETPINMSEHHDPNAHQSVAQRLYERLRGETKMPGEEIPDGARVLLVPEGLHERLDQYAHPNGGGPEQSRYDRINRAYQKILIGTYPSTWLGNAPGSIPLAVASGAISPLDYVRAFQHGPQGPVSRALGIERDNSRNAAIQNLGVSGGLGALQPRGLLAPFEKGRELSIQGENFAAAASWEGRARVAVDGRVPTLRKIIPGLDKVMPKSMKGMAARMSVDAAQLHRWLRKNEMTDDEGKAVALTPELQKVHDRLTQDVIDFMSEGAKPHGKLGRGVGKVLLFQNWIGHIVKLTLFTLPIKHPRRAVLLNALAMYGNQYRQEHGAYPGWMTQFLPLWQEGDQQVSAGLGQLTPMASAQNLAQAGSNLTDVTNPSNSILRQGASVVSPLLQPFINAILAQNDNMHLHANEKAAKSVDPLKILTSGLYYAIPGAHKFGPTSGYAPGSALFMGHALPYLGAEKKAYYEYIWNGDGTYTKVPIPWGQRPGGHPMTGPLGDLSRVIGLPLEKSPTRGLSNQVGHTNDETFQQVDWYNKITHPVAVKP